MRKSNPADVNVDQLRELGYERSDVVLPTLLKWISFMFVFIAFCSLVSWVIFIVFVPEIGRKERVDPAKMVEQMPGGMAIQPAPRPDMKKFRETEDHLLTSYGWADKSAGTVHIPIDKAMAAIAERGLPSREPGPIPSAGTRSSAASPTTPNDAVTRPAETGNSTTVTVPGQATGAEPVGH